ncbi:monocyte chemotactic protein 1B-like [Corythoichthys intestinalis]|uniref:monocyte chemotactic protein 1B-like n=1 Tax=Corythoichthys intestinalis TaxID=161448 RepID=UPI0025A6803A|nr:monocyte chemotactic protein 1B-like [Corythoichthys intestinalis]XP_061795557.1 monocyte chemotactic protein 1B-like [Nerophis lumbriciformis]
MTALKLLCLFLLAVTVPGAIAQGGIPSCCRKISNTQVHRDLLTKYYIQRPPSCPLHVVVFITLQGKRICAKPDKLWTQTSKAYLEGKSCPNNCQLGKQKKRRVSSELL